GTGIFTSLGFQVAGLPTGFAILALWVAGGICALCGALSYAELGAALPRSGGEYHFLGVIYHPALGFLAGWISATVGFAAPFAVSLYWVLYAYSGWNASTYIVGELRNPSRTIPLSVGLGTILVMAFYLAMNAVFLRTTPMTEMEGKQQVAVIAGAHIFGSAG